MNPVDKVYELGAALRDSLFDLEEIAAYSGNTGIAHQWRSRRQLAQLLWREQYDFLSDHPEVVAVLERDIPWITEGDLGVAPGLADNPDSSTDSVEPVEPTEAQLQPVQTAADGLRKAVPDARGFVPLHPEFAADRSLDDLASIFLGRLRDG